MIVDTHIDVPYRLREKMEDVGLRTEIGDFDYPRARAGGLDLPFMSIYVPASYQETGGAKQLADELIDMVEGIVAAHDDKFALVDGVDRARQVFADGKIGFALGMENGAPVEDDLANLGHFHERGIRYITLTHSKDNQICDSSYDDTHTWNGLSPFGQQVVAEMNRLGIIVDVSHVSDATFERVIELTQAPVIASHSSCRAFTPGWERNISDDLIRRLADNGGVVHINFGSDFLDDEYRLQRKGHREEIKRHLEAEAISEDSPEAREYGRQFFRDHPVPTADVADVVQHIDHVVQLVGIDHVGIGSDFDGVGDSLPTGLKDVSGFPNLIDALLDAGYTEADIEKICSANLMRVWTEVEQVARRLQAGG